MIPFFNCVFQLPASSSEEAMKGKLLGRERVRRKIDKTQKVCGSNSGGGGKIGEWTNSKWLKVLFRKLIVEWRWKGVSGTEEKRVKVKEARHRRRRRRRREKRWEWSTLVWVSVVWKRSIWDRIRPVSTEEKEKAEKVDDGKEEKVSGSQTDVQQQKEKEKGSFKRLVSKFARLFVCPFAFLC